MKFNTFRSLSWLAIATLSPSFVSLGCASVSPEQGTDSEPNDVAHTVQMVTGKQGNWRLYVSDHGAFEDRNGQRVVVFRASTNRNISDAFSFVPDDAFGTVNLLGPRSFEIVLHVGSELNSILSGLPLFLTITPQNTSTAQPIYAQVKIAPEFGDFTGTSSLWITKEIRPIYVKTDTNNPLRYRGKVAGKTALESLNVYNDDDSDPEVTRVDAKKFNFDWNFNNLALSADPPTDPMYFSAKTASGTQLSKKAYVQMQVTGVELSFNDPYDQWPSPTCMPSVYECVKNSPASVSDYEACGDYRQVQVCKYADECSVYGTAPLSLSALDLGDTVSSSVTTYNQACNKGYTWCGVKASGFSIPYCAANPSLPAVVALLEQQIQGFIAGGSYITREQLETKPFFSSAYSSGGPALLASLDALGGGGDVQAYTATSELSCHNCHEFQDEIVLFYPQTGVVIRLTGTHGYDS
jgi:hypothetical protein